jgi:hypothetical protein
VVGPRDYSKGGLIIDAEEALVVETALPALRSYLSSHKAEHRLSNYYLEVTRSAPSFWFVVFHVNDAAVRGGSIRVQLDGSGKRVLAVTAIE